MKLSARRHSFVQELTKFYGVNEAQSFFKILAEYYWGWKAVDLILKADHQLSARELTFFEKAKIRLLQQEPIQYILGETEFFGFRIGVNNQVLIPRPETEELIAWILEEVQVFSSPLKILDIGTGSGCIAIALAKHIPHAQVFALDVSPQALAVAQSNAALHQVHIQFLRENILETAALSGNFDLIVSNPPYVRTSEKKAMKSNVLDNEPHLALFVPDNDPLRFYKKIMALAKNSLSCNGLLFFEINQYLGQEMIALAKTYGLDLEIKNDLFGAQRMGKGSFK